MLLQQSPIQILKLLNTHKIEGKYVFNEIKNYKEKARKSINDQFSKKKLENNFICLFRLKLKLNNNLILKVVTAYSLIVIICLIQ